MVIPNRDRSNALLRAALSVLNQTKAAGEVELVVVDDASAAEPAAAYGALAARGARILRLPERRGGSHARNVGVAAARGDFVALLDSDDLWLPGRLDRLRALLPGLGARALLSGALVLERGALAAVAQPPWPAGLSPAEFVYRDGGRLQTSMLVLPRALALAHPFREDLRVNQDSDLALRLHAAGVGFLLDPVPGVIKDESDAADRLTRDPALVDLSHAWFRAVSGDWSAGARRGFHLRDRLWRLADAGRRAEAAACLARAIGGPADLAPALRVALRLAVGDAAYDRMQRAFRRRAPKPHGLPADDPAALWRAALEAEAAALLAGAAETASAAQASAVSTAAARAAAPAGV